MNKYEDRFHRKYEINKDTNCWEWTAGRIGNKRPNFRYGGFFDGKKVLLAHRYSYELKYGNIKKGMIACHKCDNPLCVNPDHIFIGTYQDNMTDMVNKGRSSNGVSKYCAKLTAENVIDIRKSKDMQKDLAVKYGVSRSQISRVKSGLIYKNT